MILESWTLDGLVEAAKRKPGQQADHFFRVEFQKNELGTSDLKTPQIRILGEFAALFAYSWQGTNLGGAGFAQKSYFDNKSPCHRS